MLDQYIGQTLAEKYRIESAVRESGLGKIYRATHLSMDKSVTVKILASALAVDEKIVKRFSAEARTVSHISHPNILNVIDFGSDANGAVYIVLEGLEGDPLKEIIKSENQFDPARAVNVARQISAALSAAHAYGIVHGSLNSENVFVTSTADDAELVKVLDFGALSTDDTELLSDEAYTKNIEYRSPEQNSSVSEADERSDIYALGVVFYEMLAGELPFTAETPTAFLMKQAETPPSPLSAFRQDLPDQIEPLALKALAKNPEMRYQTALEFSEDLSRALRINGVMEIAAVPNAAEDYTKNNLWKTAFVVLAGISMLAIGLIYATSSKQTNPATQMQIDANGQPVQPLNPPTGLNETGAASVLPQYTQDFSNSNMLLTMPQQPQTLPGGDNYDPWARGGQPPPGAPPYPLAPGGQMIDPSNPTSIFMQDGTVLIPVPVNTNTNANTKPSPTPTGKPTPSPANTQPTPAPTEAAPTPTAKPSPPAPEKTPAAQPTKPPPSSTDTRAESGKREDS